MRQCQQTGDIGIADRDAVAGQIHADETAGVVEGELSFCFPDAAHGSHERRVGSWRALAGLDPSDQRFLALVRRKRLATRTARPPKPSRQNRRMGSGPLSILMTETVDSREC